MASPRVAHCGRGVYRDEVTFPGTVVFRVYDCQEELVARIEMKASWCDDNTEHRLCVALSERCPEWCNGDHSVTQRVSRTVLRAL